MNEFLILILIYFIIGTYLAFYARKKGVKTHEEYFIANRNVSGIISALTYAATTYSAFMMVGLVGLSYATGIGAAGFELFYLVGTLFLLSYYAPKVWEISKREKIVSPTEFLERRYGKNTALTAAIISLIALIPYTSIQLIGVSLLIERTANISYEVAIIISAFLIAFWALIGGLRGVAWTDAVQGIIMLTAAFLAIFYVSSMFKTSFISEVGRLGELLVVPNKIWTPLRFASLTIPWFFFALTNPQVFQRLYIPENKRAVKSMVVYFGIFGLIYTVLVTLLGLMLRTLTEIGEFPLIKDRDLVTPTLLNLMPTSIALIIALSILAAAVTTANSIILSLSSMVSRDIVKEKGMRVGQISVIILTILVAIFASFRPGYIVELSVLSSTILLSLLILIIGIFHSEWNNGLPALLSAFITALILSLIKNPYTPIITLAIGFFVFYIINKIK